MAKISVMGTGSWGTALAILLHNNGHQVMLWSAHPEKAASLNQTREDPKKLPGIKIPDGIVITGDEKTALDSPDIVVFASPSAYMRAISKRLSPLIRRGQIIVNVAKGVEENTLMPVCDIIKEEIPQADVCVLSGPSHAEEVSRGLPTTCVVSARKKETAEYLQGLFMSPVFRVYTTPDMLGVELGGALKNIIALAAGILDGMKIGDNARAALMTRGLAEITRLGTAMGAQADVQIIESYPGVVNWNDMVDFARLDRHLHQRPFPEPSGWGVHRSGPFPQGSGGKGGDDGGRDFRHPLRPRTCHGLPGGDAHCGAALPGAARQL